MITSTPAIQVAIFDLDDTLYDCCGQRLLAAHRYASQAMVAAGVRATVDEVLQARMEAFRRDPRLGRIDAEVCRRLSVHNSEEVSRAARDAFFTAPVGELSLFPGTLTVLRTLKARGVRIFVVTFGNPETQRSKVVALGLDREASVDRIFYADRGNAVTKESVFETVLQETGAAPAQVLVVGDRPDGEIRAGRRLGMRTVRLRRGEFASLEPRGPDEQADYEITAIDSVLEIPLISCGVD